MTTKRSTVSIILKAVVILSAAIGIPLSAFADVTGFMAGKTVFMFFTVQSNILIAGICLAGAVFLILKRKPDPRWYVFKFVGTVAITLTGVVFCVVLAPTLGQYALNIQNVLTHVIAPLSAIADFYVSGIDAELSKKNLLTLNTYRSIITKIFFKEVSYE